MKNHIHKEKNCRKKVCKALEYVVRTKRKEVQGVRA